MNLMTFETSPQLDDLIRKRAKQEGREPTEVLHRSVVLYAYLNDHIEDTTDEIAIASNGRLKKVLKGLL